MRCMIYAAILALLSYGFGRHASAEGPIRLATGPNLFVDDYLIDAERSHDIVRTTHAPEKLPLPILNNEEIWHQQPLVGRVIRDEQTNKYRMWYNVRNPGQDVRTCFSYAESNDGIHWMRPNLALVSVAGSKQNNIIIAPNHFGSMVNDAGPGCEDPPRRYKIAYYDESDGNGGLYLAFSADGYNFTRYQGNPVLANPLCPIGDPAYADVVSDVMNGCWDPLKNQYLLVCKQWDTGYPGKPANADQGWRRTVAMTTSTDFVTWDTPRQIITPDPNNGLEEFYSFQPVIRGNLYLGLLHVLRDDLAADRDGPVNGIGWTELVTSRDGKNWTRHQDKFLDRDPTTGAWDHAMAWAGDCLTVGDKEYIYYGGYSAGHKVGERRVGMAMLRKNGFVSRDACNREGLLRTPLVVFDGDAMTINADVDGNLRVRILDQNNHPLSGFNWSEFRPIVGDSVAFPALWTGDFASLRGTLVRFEFAMNDARLYGFDIVELPEPNAMVMSGAAALIGLLAHTLRSKKKLAT